MSIHERIYWGLTYNPSAGLLSYYREWWFNDCLPLNILQWEKRDKIEENEWYKKTTFWTLQDKEKVQLQYFKYGKKQRMTIKGNRLSQYLSWMKCLRILTLLHSLILVFYGNHCQSTDLSRTNGWLVHASNIQMVCETTQCVSSGIHVIHEMFHLSSTRESDYFFNRAWWKWQRAIANAENCQHSMQRFWMIKRHFTS